jgi:hypothetical protein
MLLHRTMVQEELERNRHPRRVEPSRRRPSLVMAVRAGVGRALIATGTRLAPTHDRPEPAVGRLSTAR